MKLKNKQSLWFVFTVKGDNAYYKKCTNCGSVTYCGHRPLIGFNEEEEINISPYCEYCGKKHSVNVIEFYHYVKGGPILIEKI